MMMYLITWSEAGGGSNWSHSQLVKQLFWEGLRVLFMLDHAILVLRVHLHPFTDNDDDDDDDSGDDGDND